MSFFFRGRGKPSPQELSRLIAESLLALDGKATVEVKLLEKALEEVEKNTLLMRQMLSGDRELEANPEHASQLIIEICKEDILSLFIHKLPMLSWEARKDLVHCWAILLRDNGCLDYIENHPALLDFLIICYNNKNIALHCGNMLRECIKYPSITRCILELPSLGLFFKYVELPNFDIASDALATFKDLFTKHEAEVSQFLTNHYLLFFEHYEKLLSSTNYVTRRQSLKLLLDILLEPSNAQVLKRFILETEFLKIIMTLLKDSSKNIQLSAFDIFKVFVANPNKSPEIISILTRNHEALLLVLRNLPASKAEDDEFEEERDLIIQKIEALGSPDGTT